jgi:amidase
LDAVEMSHEMITDWNATQLSAAIHARSVSCKEVMQAYLARIGKLQDTYRPFVNLAPEERLLAQADQADKELAAGTSRGWLHGVPQAIKDISPLKGFPSTMGSRLLANNMPSEDSLMAARIRAAGAIFIGKTNTPEFGLGSHTFNDLFGATHNAWDKTKTAGGSSGGAAVALALHLLPVADGSDSMGSLRNPAGWNNVIGMRPSVGRVPFWPASDVWMPSSGTEGPMGRSLEDVARLMAIQSGPDRRVPTSRHDVFDLQQALKPWSGEAPRVAWFGDLNGYLATDPGLLAVCDAAVTQWQSCGARVEACELGFSKEQLWEAWLVWRRSVVGPRVAPMLAMAPNARELIKPEALWEYDQSLQVSMQTLNHASAVRSSFYQHYLSLMERFDVLVLPSAQVWPFDVTKRWPEQVAGRSMDTYHRWMEVTIYATMLGAPAICMPAGFDAASGLPIGVQLIGRPGADAQVLQVAAHFEAAMRAKYGSKYLSSPNV